MKRQNSAGKEVRFMPAALWIAIAAVFLRGLSCILRKQK